MGVISGEGIPPEVWRKVEKSKQGSNESADMGTALRLLEETRVVETRLRIKEGRNDGNVHFDALNEASDRLLPKKKP
jgi:hypothetical protein